MYIVPSNKAFLTFGFVITGSGHQNENKNKDKKENNETIDKR